MKKTLKALAALLVLALALTGLRRQHGRQQRPQKLRRDSGGGPQQRR